MIDTFEKIPIEIHDDSKSASKKVAQQIAALIKEKAFKKKSCVLGMATGSTPTTALPETF